ncbi:hypothetical protein SELMODRAFT_179800 [Selaginella moellendorffii]|uniref:Major facilitator superfamily (MFS) profile domain-containing protein n=1 Tax=Selaginella moellendorffii TaxID=88036 RepID=D8SHL3_SELML|nr:hypothetical protein SELMODRAFT_179800 [Selaginella moellendorffii]
MEPCPSLTSNKRVTPPGIAISRSLSGRQFQYGFYRFLVLALTFVAYACYHASRKPPSIVKSVLDPERSSSGENQGWYPFNGRNGKVRLGEVDLAFLAFYAFAMFFAGHLGDTMDLRVFLSIGMVGSGIFVCLFGMAYWWNIHDFYYFMFVQIMAGLFQATGWPSVVAIVGNWFGKSKRGLIMGIWNAHTSVGNIIGSLVAASALELGWGYSFIFPGVLIIVAGILVFLFLVVEPADVDLPSPAEVEATENATKVAVSSSSLRISEPARDDLEAPLISSAQQQHSRAKSPERGKAVEFLQAWKIPGVLPFAFCLFFCKLVAYTFLYWLPFYIKQTRVGAKSLSEKTAGNLSTLFDIGGVFGGILAGYASDRLKARAITAATMTYLAIPALLLYHRYGSTSMASSIALMMITGMLVNGPYALITTAVSADLGTHSSLKGDARALATVTAIIDGCGSLGAAIGPVLTGYLSTSGWDKVFYMLMVAALVAGLLLTRLVAAEIREKVSSYHSRGMDSFQFLKDGNNAATATAKLEGDRLPV